VIFDGDYCDDDPTADETKKKSKREQTTECVGALGLHGEDKEPLFTYGDQSTLLDDAAIFKSTLEDELALWTSYTQAESRINRSRAKKNAYRYGRAARSSSAEDMPEFLRELVDKIIQCSVTKQEWYDQP
jgi:hypothetical protein